MFEQMRAKGFLLLSLCIVATIIIVCMYGDPKPSIHELVSETHRQLSQLKKLKQVVVPPKNEPELDKKYLKALGFTEEPRLYPNQVWQNVTLPVLVTAVKEGQVELAVGFIKSVQQFLPDHLLLVYNLDLDQSDIASIRKHCNSSNCVIKKFDFEYFPSHVSDLKLYAYRPIIIQDILDKAGAVLWMDVQYYLISKEMEKLFQRAQKQEVLCWNVDHQPTSALTHPRMFEYFHTQPENYYFHRMVEPSQIVLYNTNRVHFHLMLPWVRCALILDCIAPIGAQSSGCRFDKKPMYRYSGCHRYDMSALNVVLGLMFNYDDKSYMANDKDLFFQRRKAEDSSEKSVHPRWKVNVTRVLSLKTVSKPV